MTIIRWFAFKITIVMKIFSRIFGQKDKIFTIHICYRLHKQRNRLVLYWYRLASFQRNPHKHHHLIQNGVYLLRRWNVFVYFFFSVILNLSGLKKRVEVHGSIIPTALENLKKIITTGSIYSHHTRQPYTHHTSWQNITKGTEIMHTRHAILNPVF